MYTERGNFANPRDDRPDIIGTLEEIKSQFLAWYKLHLGYYNEKDLKNGQICANVYRGKTIKEYPDFQLIIGRQGGVKKIAT
jgi:hypothetical protein